MSWFNATVNTNITVSIQSQKVVRNSTYIGNNRLNHAVHGPSFSSSTGSVNEEMTQIPQTLLRRCARPGNRHHKERLQPSCIADVGSCAMCPALTNLQRAISTAVEGNLIATFMKSQAPSYTTTNQISLLANFCTGKTAISNTNRTNEIAAG